MRAEAVVPQKEEWRTQYDEFHVSPAIRVGDTVYCCGITGWDAQRGGYPEDLESQFEQAFRNVGVVLGAARASWGGVVKVVSHHVGDLHSHIPAFVRVRDRFVVEPYPISTAAVVVALPHPDALIQLDVTAVTSNSPTAGTA